MLLKYALTACLLSAEHGESKDHMALCSVLGTHIIHEYVHISWSLIHCLLWIFPTSLSSCVYSLPHFLESEMDLSYILASVKWVCPGNVGDMSDLCHTGSLFEGLWELGRDAASGSTRFGDDRLLSSRSC